MLPIEAEPADRRSGDFQQLYEQERMRGAARVADRKSVV